MTEEKKPVKKSKGSRPSGFKRVYRPRRPRRRTTLPANLSFDRWMKNWEVDTTWEIMQEEEQQGDVDLEGATKKDLKDLLE